MSRFAWMLAGAVVGALFVLMFLFVLTPAMLARLLP